MFEGSSVHMDFPVQFHLICCEDSMHSSMLIEFRSDLSLVLILLGLNLIGKRS
jgi:hypothetical protein